MKLICDKCKEDILEGKQSVIKPTESYVKLVPGISLDGTRLFPKAVSIFEFGSITLCPTCAKLANRTILNFLYGD